MVCIYYFFIKHHIKKIIIFGVVHDDSDVKMKNAESDDSDLIISNKNEIWDYEMR